MNLFPFLVFIATIIFEVATKKRLQKDQILNDPLTKNEKILTWVLCVFNPVLAGAILYYGWKKRLPIKAKQANTISLWAFFLAIVLVVILFLLGIVE